MQIILASSSARRKEISKQLGIEVEIMIPIIKETLLKTPVEAVVCNATRKAVRGSESEKRWGIGVDILQDGNYDLG